MDAIIAFPRSRLDIRCIAQGIRKHCKFKDRFPIVHFLEIIMPCFDEKFQLIVVEDNELPNCYAKANPAEHIIFVRESVYLGAINGNGRDRFTLCHEFGHYILHKSTSIFFLRIQEGKKIPAYREPEWQADTFAGELLIPYKIAVSNSVEDIVSICGVSYAAAKIQKRICQGIKNKPPCGYKARRLAQSD